jgi:hypothetical protein
LSGWRDLNPRPLAPQTSTLTGLSHIPNGPQTYKKILRCQVSARSAFFIFTLAKQIKLKLCLALNALLC